MTDFVWPHLQANALYQGAYPLATALARPLIAQLLVEVAEREGADAVAHGCTGKGNDQVRFDVAIHALDPGLEVIAPMRVGMGLSRDQEIDYAARARASRSRSPRPRPTRSTSTCGAARARRACSRTRGSRRRPTPTSGRSRRPTRPTRSRSSIAFEGGIPVALDGERLAPVELVERLHALGGAHGVGRIDHVEDRLVGIKSREIYETPAATILHAAHRALEGLTLSRDTLRFNRFVADELARLIYDGLWFSALSRDLRGVRRVLAAGRVGRGPDAPRSRPGRSSSGGARRCRSTTRASRRTTRATPSTTRPRSGSSRSSGCRCGWRPPATARSASTTARPGPGPTRSSRPADDRHGPGAAPAV